MQNVKQNTHGLIRNRSIGAVALLLTGFVAVLSFRDVLSHTPHRSDWLISLSFLPLKWMWAANIVFYAYLIWLCFSFFRVARNNERVLVAGWAVGIVLGPMLGPIKNLVSQSAAAAIQDVNAACIGAAFVAAIFIFREHLTRTAT
jgi:hypothetical protein